jgi:hypothetical protein
MLPFGVTALEFAVVTFLSAFVGVVLMIGASRYVSARFLAAFALGVYLWFFPDTLGGANYLDALNGPVFSVGLAALLVLFAVALFGFFATDRRLFSAETPGAKAGIAVALVAALAIGLHGFGEGADFGVTAALTPSNTLLGAFGGLVEGVSWIFHKMFEPMIAAACYVAFVGPAGRRAKEKLVDALGIAAVFVTPAVVGSIAGYYVNFDTSYFFAFGLGASVYAAARIAKALFAGQETAWLTLKVATATILGFLCIYFAALLHS